MRRRALRSLQFKLQHGLVDAASLSCADSLAAAADRLLFFLLQPAEPVPGGAVDTDADDAVIALELLAVMARQPGAAAQLLQLGADQVLIHVADQLPGCAQPASAILGELLCSVAAGCAGADGSVCPLERTPYTELVHAPAPDPQLSPVGATRASLPWPAASPVAALRCAASPRASMPQPSPAPRGLAAGSLRVRAAQLSKDDSQQLFEVALELQLERAAEPAGEAALLATLATLRHGVLADMPAAAIAGQPNLLQGLLRLVAWAQARPAVAAASLAVLQALATSLAAAEPAPEGEAGLPLAPLALDCLLCCAPLLHNGNLQPQALAACQVLLPLLEPHVDAGMDGGNSSSSGSGCLVLAPLVAALTEALRLDLVRPSYFAGAHFTPAALPPCPPAQQPFQQAGPC